jgi:hypothetical protein
MKKGEIRRGPFSCSRIEASSIPAGIHHRLMGGCQTEQDEIVDPALFLGIDPVVRVEAAVRAVAARHLAGDAGGQVVGPEFGDRRSAGFTLQQPRPGFLDTAGKRRDKTKAGYDNSAHDCHAERPIRRWPCRYI